MSLDDASVKNVAKLSALAISDEELPEIREKLNIILGYVDRLSELPTRGVVPTFYINDAVNVFREDVTQTSLSLDEVRLNAPDFIDGNFRVPRIIKKEE